MNASIFCWLHAKERHHPTINFDLVHINAACEIVVSSSSNHTDVTANINSRQNTIRYIDCHHRLLLYHLVNPTHDNGMADADSLSRSTCSSSRRWWTFPRLSLSVWRRCCCCAWLLQCDDADLGISVFNAASAAVDMMYERSIPLLALLG